MTHRANQTSAARRDRARSTPPGRLPAPPHHPPHQPPFGGPLTDLLADPAALRRARARHRHEDGARHVGAHLRPGRDHGLPGRRRGDPARRRGGAGPAQVPVGRRGSGGAGGDPGHRGAAGGQRGRHPLARGARPQAARCASRRTACTSTRSVEHGLDPAKNDNRILAASLGQAVHGRTVVVSNDAALRIKAAQLGLEAMEHQRLRGRSLLRAAGRLAHHRGQLGDGRRRLHRPQRPRRRRPRPG